jgi:proteasome accessory factor C
MVPWVMSHPETTADEVCERFGYPNRNQLVDDLNLVFVCGLPGYGPGELMVAYLDEDEVVIEMADYFASPIRLTAPEALGLLAAGYAIRGVGLGTDALDRALAKLERVVLPEGDDTVVVELAEPDLVPELRAASSTGEVVEIVYTALSSGETTEREIEPWAMFSTLGNWYVRAWCRRADAERVFRVDRIRGARPTGETFDPPAEPTEPVVQYTPDLDDVEATMRLGPAAKWVAEYFPVEIAGESGDGLIVRMSASDPLVPARLLLRLGADAELVSGKEVAVALDRLRARILARYSDAARND